MRTDGQAMTMLIVAFRSFVNAAKLKEVYRCNIQEPVIYFLGLFF